MTPAQEKTSRRLCLRYNRKARVIGLGNEFTLHLARKEGGEYEIVASFFVFTACSNREIRRIMGIIPEFLAAARRTMRAARLNLPVVWKK